MIDPPRIDLPKIDTAAELLADHARRRRDAPALVAGSVRLSYGDLADRVDRCAAGLRALGVRAGTPVGLLCTNRAEWVVTALATMALGARVAAFNTWSRRVDLDHLLRASACEVLVAVGRGGAADLEPVLREVLPEAFTAAGPGWRSAAYPRLRELVLVDGDRAPGVRAFDELHDELLGDELLGDELQGGDADELAQAGSRDDVAMVLYTSGSTAQPKAVTLLQGAACEHGFDVGVRMGLEEGDRVWVPVPLFWSYGGANALMVTLAHGACLVLQEVFEAGAALRLVEAQRCTVAYTLPNITAALLGHPDFTPARVASLCRGMTIGSARDVRAALDGLGITGICNAYGSTEIYGGATVTPHDWPADRKADSQGPALPRITLTVRGADDEPVPAGETGEITVSGQVTPGYLDQPVGNAAAFTADGAFRTGDLGFLDPDGTLHFVARATEMIRCGGINIAPGEVEELLRTHPEVEQAAVVGAPDEARGQVAVGFVTLGDTATVDGPGLVAWCRERVASFKVPAVILVGTAPLPTTGTGKLARGPLRERAADEWSAHV